MTDREVHVGTTVPVAFLAVALGYHPLVALPLVLGVLLPEVDAIRESLHRSWALHTFLLPSLVYALAEWTGVLTGWFALALHFFTLGMALHLLTDFVYPRTMTHEGAGWPVRPAIVSSPWGLLWLGIAWTVQWFLYLSPSFIPWLVGYSG